MGEQEQKALRHIVKHGDDKNLRAKSWQPAKVSLYRRGLLKRRVSDWAWVPTVGASDWI